LFRKGETITTDRDVYILPFRYFFDSFALYLKASDQHINRLLLWSAFVLLIPALLINLGLMTYIDDEAIRALVAFEMDKRGNFIVPTTYGFYYYNKPPLYNWILHLFFSATGTYNEFSSRLATVVALLGYGATIYYFFRKHFPSMQALLTALLFITCGRVLLWDSALGLIDMTFSWVTFLNFMLVYHLSERQRWWSLFLLTYLLTAIAFLLKGLPALVFQATTLLAWFIYKKQFRRLISLPHIAGILLLFGVLGLYYGVYHQYNSLEVVLDTLLNESSKRTVVNYGIWQTIQHFFTFPFEMTYHFVPWSVFILLFFQKGIYQKITSRPFTAFLALIFLANLILYWLSVEVYPRYLLMHAPLLFGLSIFLYFEPGAQKMKLGLERFLLVLSILFLLGSTIPLWVDRPQDIAFRIPKVLFLFFSLLTLIILFYRRMGNRLLLMVNVLILVRIGFNWFVLPDRHQQDWGTLVKQTTLTAAQQVPEGEKAYIYKGTPFPFTNCFYFSTAADQIVERRVEGFEKGDLIIADQEKYPKILLSDTIPIKIRTSKRTIYLARYQGRK
jgi:4-amino-4-deoxy-L-arabinose transferase-like glycosyltransferase